MNTATKLTGFLFGLVAVFGAAYGVGQLTDPVTSGAEIRHEAPGHENGHDESGREGPEGDEVRSPVGPATTPTAPCADPPTPTGTAPAPTGGAGPGALGRGHDRQEAR
ncbi:hypothetical protein [Salinispora arenicola]|uniref:Uncharacterized protein n=1 Tax=Salinispora arenicola TaxID=168697 RepID=A0A542XIJ3_SALAC|nr:hypothetical protein [Salinispora arenicola]MCN0150611.1 hypothetical protein [Salinispora arenicola]MCN0177263.1 hypothetical protein [Salinispora arenicola]TQL35669.1 hypothetical protein FB564_0733 [Salinispora arenicola]GIM81699.1 hypothetical protein Sar04_03470 [Salinispora arenicola]